ncbi:MAG: Glycerol-3-phosphate dehydrogenase [uncultured Chloroflexi bacterium]|uniref:Glycerol-3-phosphate dehydrogenase n=1 Tax=uncultured Chloroflexota bacterium TaxID=166587 RepID=A0A6J4IQ64_9CHLR|nr:MAG: Glycerol-3-phosphate dehydrogenase [uncultured Chloroflexota bacterium]
MNTSEQRRTTVEALRATREHPLDVLVVGGGIVGAGIARDAALRGFRVGLVEQRDLASGTSSRPTRLIHGGLRYLENYDFGLVREDLREREILLRVAPHLVFPLPFLLPQYGRSQAYQAKLSAGMLLYDLLSYDKSLPSRRWLSREQLLATEPGIDPEGLQGAWRYYDAQVPYVERLVVENALDAAAHGAHILTHARVERFLRQSGTAGTVTGALVRDTLGGGELEVRAHLTINATGPWLDRTDGEIRPGRPPLLRLTKGVHLVTPPGTRHAHVLFSQTDGRLFFVVPWHGCSLVGTTDTDYHGDPADAAADQEDVTYLSTEARRAFPQAPFDQVHYTWAGVRALGRVEGVQEGKVSRKHKLLDHEAREGVPGIVSVVGGKITAYRGIAEEVGDLVSTKLGRTTRGYTDRRPFPGGTLGQSADLASFVATELRPRALSLGLDAAQAERLGRLYGALAHEVLDLAERDRGLAERLAPGSLAVAAELARAIDREWTITLPDFLLRRSDLGLNADQALPHLDAIATRMAALCGWDATDTDAQVAAYRAELDPMRRLSSSSEGRAVPGDRTARRPGLVAAGG